MAQRQIVVGLVGQVCAGKSSVAEAFRRRGAVIYDADKQVREVYARPEVVEHVKALFGLGVVSADGKVDRAALAKRVFNHPDELKRLTDEVIFPRTGAAMQEEMKKFRESGAPVLVLDAPTLFEAGRDGICDHIVFVAASIGRRQQWAKARGWDAGELERRDRALGDEARKRQRASAVIDNSGTLEDVDRQVEMLFRKWSTV
ncbi:MAG TPA: dephospho-CoA kinase [Planctomycetota bacterium]|jgi:dephospho-CoA kinase